MSSSDLGALEHERGLHVDFRARWCGLCWPDGLPRQPVSIDGARAQTAEQPTPAAHRREHERQQRGEGFEPLRAALQRYRAGVRIVDEPGDADQSPLRDGGPADCPTCRGYRWVRQEVASRDDPRFGKLAECPTCFHGFLLQRRIERLWGQLPTGLRGLTLETLEQRSDDHATVLVPLLRQWLEAQGAPWLYLFSPSGHGKTGAGVGLLHAAAQRGQTVAFCFVLDMLARLRRTYRSREACDEDEAGLFAALYAADLVLIDDLGVEHHRPGEGVDWATEKIHQLVEGRYVARQRTILTSNLDLRQLTDILGHERTASRIHEMTRGDRWCLDLTDLPNLRLGVPAGG